MAKRRKPSIDKLRISKRQKQKTEKANKELTEEITQDMGKLGETSTHNESYKTPKEFLFHELPIAKDSSSSSENIHEVQKHSNVYNDVPIKMPEIEIIDVDELPDRPDSPIGDDVVEICLPSTPSSFHQSSAEKRRMEARRSVVDLTFSPVTTPAEATPSTSRDSDAEGFYSADPRKSTYNKNAQNEEKDGSTKNSSLNELINSNKDFQVICPVCMDNPAQISSDGRQLTSTICGHVFCNNCINAAVQTMRKCPTCRKKLKKSHLHPIFI